MGPFDYLISIVFEKLRAFSFFGRMRCKMPMQQYRKNEIFKMKIFQNNGKFFIRNLRDWINKNVLLSGCPANEGKNQHRDYDTSNINAS